MATKTIKGTVVSNKMKDTVVVEILNQVKHPRYHKYIQKKKKLYAHTNEDIAEGTEVLLQEVRPLSKTKRWQVISEKKD